MKSLASSIALSSVAGVGQHPSWRRSSSYKRCRASTASRHLVISFKSTSSASCLIAAGTRHVVSATSTILRSELAVQFVIIPYAKMVCESLKLLLRLRRQTKRANFAAVQHIIVYLPLYVTLFATISYTIVDCIVKYICQLSIGRIYSLIDCPVYSWKQKVKRKVTWSHTTAVSLHVFDLGRSRMTAK